MYIFICTFFHQFVHSFVCSVVLYTGAHLDTRVSALLRSLHRLLNPSAMPKKGRPPKSRRTSPTPHPTTSNNETERSPLQLGIDDSLEKSLLGTYGNDYMPSFNDDDDDDDNDGDHEQDDDDDGDAEGDYEYEDEGSGGGGGGTENNDNEAEKRRCDGLLAGVDKDIALLVDIREQKYLPKEEVMQRTKTAIFNIGKAIGESKDTLGEEWGVRLWEHVASKAPGQSAEKLERIYEKMVGAHKGGEGAEEGGEMSTPYHAATYS